MEEEGINAVNFTTIFFFLPEFNITCMEERKKSEYNLPALSKISITQKKSFFRITIYKFQLSSVYFSLNI